MSHHHEHEPYVEDYFLATTEEVIQLTPSMTRVVLTVQDGERLVATDHPDEWVRLALRPNPETPVTLPVLMENGRWGRPDGSLACPNRPYTVRAWNPATCEMVIDLVAHEGGVAAGWAMAARVGDVVGICNPEGRFEPPPGAKWMLLLVDITGLPAVGRILEELPAEMHAIVHVEIPSAADRQRLDSRADVELVWHEMHGRRDGSEAPTRLPEIAARFTTLPDGPGYIYIAGEARAASACRKHFRDRLGFDKHAIDAIGYWIEGQARV